MSELSPKAAALVRAGRGALRPSAADRERVSAALRACLGDAALPLEAGASAATPFSRSLWAKASALGAAIGFAGVAAFVALHDSSSTVGAQAALSASAPISPSQSASRVQAPAAASEAAAPLASPEPGLVSEGSAGPARRPSDRLAQEVAILSRATSELHAGRAASALRAVEEHQRKFPSGLLAEERRAARVQALCALGRRAEAEPELARLARRAPQSPNTLRAQQLCGVSASSQPSDRHGAAASSVSSMP